MKRAPTIGALLESTATFRPALWLPSCHLTTAFGPLARRSSGPQLGHRLVRAFDGESLDTYWLSGDPHAPTVVLLHGLEGSVKSHYMAGQLSLIERLGWNAVALEFRSCGPTWQRGPRLYHLGETTDLAALVAHLVSIGRSRIYLSGVSLGGNVVLKFLGEDPQLVPSQVRGACAISPPFDLTKSGPQIDRVLFGLYTRRFLRSLVPKALRKAVEHPDRLDAEAIAKCRTFEEFDTLATARLHGFEDAWDYWERCSSGRFLDRIERPTQLICARDDPFHLEESLPRDALTNNPQLTAHFPRRGGHVGFVEGAPWRARSWAEHKALAHFVALDAEYAPRPESN